MYVYVTAFILPVNLCCGLIDGECCITVLEWWERTSCSNSKTRHQG